MRPSVYFACAISAGRQDALVYSRIAAVLSCHARVITPEFAAVDFFEDPSLSPARVNERDLNLLVNADCLIAEITVPSLGVGYEISKAESWGKPVLCLYRPRAGVASPMITGAKGVAAVRYRKQSDLAAVIEPFLATLVN